MKIENLLALLNESAIETTPYGIEYFNLELKLSFDNDKKLWTGQILNDAGIAENGAGIELNFSDKNIETVIDKLYECLDSDRH